MAGRPSKYLHLEEQTYSNKLYHWLYAKRNARWNQPLLAGMVTVVIIVASGYFSQRKYKNVRDRLLVIQSNIAEEKQRVLDILTERGEERWGKGEHDIVVVVKGKKDILNSLDQLKAELTVQKPNALTPDLIERHTTATGTATGFYYPEDDVTTAPSKESPSPPVTEGWIEKLAKS